MNRFDTLAPLLEGFVKDGPAGCSLQVEHHGETVFRQCFGYADLEAKTPITPDTLFRIFSMTKVITCTAALILYERGRYLLNDPLEEYLPEFKNPQVFRYTSNHSLYTSPAVSPIRVKDLFMMTSGITYGDRDTETGRETGKVMQRLDRNAAAGKPYSTRDFSRAIAAVPLSFDPGTHWRYGMSHDILAAFVEVVSGKRFSQFLQDEIFGPLGMNNTFHRLPDEKQHLLCNLYLKNSKGHLEKAQEFYQYSKLDSIYEGGGSGLISTLGDYARFLNMLANWGVLDGHRILGRKTIELMATNHLNPQQTEDFCWPHLAGYGYGLGVRTLIDPVRGGLNGNIGEFGWAGYLGTWALADPKENLTITYMQQLLPSREEYHAPRIHNAVYAAL